MKYIIKENLIEWHKQLKEILKEFPESKIPTELYQRLSNLEGVIGIEIKNIEDAMEDDESDPDSPYI